MKSLKWSKKFYKKNEESRVFNIDYKNSKIIKNRSRAEQKDIDGL